MPDENMNVDVYCQGVERVANSIFISLEVDDLPNAGEVEKWLKARLMAGNKVTAWDVVISMFYINAQNRLTKEK